VRRADMRVISQDGTIDVPYEMVVIQRFEEDIYFLNRNLTGVEDLISDIRLAKYSTEAKAIKAMEMLREAYTGKPKLNVDEIPNLTPQEFGEKLGISDILLCDKTNADVSFSSNYYFQFPQDDEIEV
jgi:hypothetical protein